MVASLTLICMKLVPWDPNTLLLVTGLLKRYQKVQIPCFLLFLCYKLLDVKKRIHKRMSILFQFSSGTWGPRIATKFTIPRESGPLQEKLWYSLAWKWMSFMEFELSDIFPLKLVANKKNAWVSVDPMLSYLWSVVSPLEEACKYFEQDC